MRKERATLKVSSIVANEGQLAWLPANPRQWTKTDIDRTRNSIQEDPDFLEDRPLLVVPLDDKTWLVFAGNLRREGAKSGKVKEVPAVIYYPETEEDHLTIKRRALKDNGSFGAWDFDALANEWDDLPMTDWGIPVPDVEKEVEKAKKDEEVAAKVPFSEVLGEEHNYVVLFFDNEVDWLQAQTLLGLEPVKALPTKRNGDNLDNFKRIGVGRVLNGPKAIEKIMAYKG